MTDHPLRQAVNVPGCEPLYPNYSSCVIAKPGRFMFVSGQVAVDENGNTIGIGDVAVQADCVLEKIRKILEYRGATLENVVQDRVYVTDREFHPLVLPVRLKHFPQNGPSSSFVEVASLRFPEWLIEIEVIAVLPD